MLSGRLIAKKKLPVATLAWRRITHDTKNKGQVDLWDRKRINAFVGHSFPDFIEGWNRQTFRTVGNGLNIATAVLGVGGVVSGSLAAFLPAAVVGALSLGYWRVGLQDIKQQSHAIRRNYPVLGNIRYVLETVRPEIRQYLVESEFDGVPFDRLHRAQIYQRAKNVNDTIPFGTRRDVYAPKHEWACHSMFPKTVDTETGTRATIGTAEFGTTRPYSASILNISGMSYGAISDNAIRALSKGAQCGGFYHNTGEGGVSQFHREGGGDLVWNVGTGYFGCGSGEGENRVFEPAKFQESIEECAGQIKMIEVKLSQGAKPGHGGLLPKAKITKEIAEARKLVFPPVGDCHSPAAHSAFRTPHELVQFLQEVRELSGGLPVGIKMCPGQPAEIAALCKAMLDVGNGPDFITVDGAEGGTGAAPPELTNSMGLPMEEGLVLVRNMLIGADLVDKVKLNASGKISSGFSLVKTIALGATITSAARAFMMSLGCIQALKCNTNKCPTGITTLDKELMFGLDPEEKTNRVYHFHRKTVKAAAGIAGIMGYEHISEVSACDIMRRQPNEVKTLSEHFPVVEPGCLVRGTAPERMQHIWEVCTKSTVKSHINRWIY